MGYIKLELSGMRETDLPCLPLYIEELIKRRTTRENMQKYKKYGIEEHVYQWSRTEMQQGFEGSFERIYDILFEGTIHDKIPF